MSAFGAGMSCLSLLILPMKIIKVVGNISGFCDHEPSESVNGGAEFAFLHKM